MADNQFSVRVPNALEALMQGQSGFNDARAYVTENEQNAARKEAQQLYESGDTRGALARLIGANDPKLVTALGQYETGANSVYGTPIYGTDEQGNTKIGTFDKRGGFRPIDTGNFTPTPGIKTVDTGTGTVVIDQRTGRPVQGAAQPAQPGLRTMPPGGPQPQGGFIPKDVAGEARERKYGTEVGDRQADLGKAKSSLDNSLNTMDRMAFEADRLSKDPGLSRITGLWGMLPNIPGQPGANANAKLETLKTQVAFGVLQAMRDASKTGGALGAVSDRENTMLGNALAALDRAQSEGEFRKALSQIVDYTKGAKQRLQQAYETDYSKIPEPNPSVQPTTQTAPRAPGGQQAPASKNIGGKNYIQINGQWFEQ